MEEPLYLWMGKPACRVLDGVLAKGGPETIMETLYTHGEPAHGQRIVQRDDGPEDQSGLVRPCQGWQIKATSQFKLV